MLLPLITQTIRIFYAKFPIYKIKKKCIKYTLIFLLSNKIYSSSCKQKMSGKCSFYTPIDNSVSNINMLDPYFITLCHSHYDTSASATIKGLVDLIRVYIQYLDAIVHHLSVTVFHIRGKDKVEFVNPLYWSGERPDVRVVSVSCVQLDVVENHDGGHMVVGYFVAESYKEGHLYNVVCCKYQQIFIFFLSNYLHHFIIYIYFKMKKKICYYVANDLLLQKYKYMYDYAQSN